jgi:hypothetical protein
MTKTYTPRPGSYAAKAVDVLLPLEGKMLASGALARLIDCKVTHVATVLEHALLHRAIVVHRTQSGNWYGIGDLYAGRRATDEARAEASRLVRQLPASTVFDLGAPPRVLPLAGRIVCMKTIESGGAKFAFWSDGAIQIQKGEVKVMLDPKEYRELVAHGERNVVEGAAA